MEAGRRRFDSAIACGVSTCRLEDGGSTPPAAHEVIQMVFNTIKCDSCHEKIGGNDEYFTVTLARTNLKQVSLIYRTPDQIYRDSHRHYCLSCMKRIMGTLENRRELGMLGI